MLQGENKAKAFPYTIPTTGVEPGSHGWESYVLAVLAARETPYKIKKQRCHAEMLLSQKKEVIVFRCTSGDN